MPLANSHSFPIFDPELNSTATGFSREAVGLKSEIERIFHTPSVAAVSISEISGSWKEIASFTTENYESKINLLHEIEEILIECSVYNWNGKGAKAVSRDAAEGVKWLIGKLPFLEDIEIVPEPDGALAVEWHKDKENWMIISFSDEKEAYYAGKFGENGRFNGKIPDIHNQVSHISHFFQFMR